MNSESAPMTDTAFRRETQALSHVGRVRQLNEDRSFSHSKMGLWAVADGMGGHEAGDFASEAIVRSLQTIPDVASAAELEWTFRKAIERANSEIFSISQERGNIVMGSTVVGLLNFEQLYRCYWCGDSRAYLLRSNELIQLSKDHTEVQELLDRGLISQEEAAVYPRRNAITHAIGVHPDVHMDYVDGEIMAGDTFLLCSDGLTAHLADLEIGQIMVGRRAEEICNELVKLTLSRGATDNVTVSVIQFFAASATIPVVGPIAYSNPAGTDR